MSDHPHRRDFVRSLALGASVGLLPQTLVADEPDKDSPNQAEPPPSEADARMALVVARFGRQLDDDARKIVRAEIDSIVQRAESLRKFPLDNSDGPFPVFHPYRAPLA